jgi:hypothetical protein
MDSNYADAIDGVLPLHYGEGRRFFIHVEFLSTQSPPGLRLSVDPNPVGQFQRGFIVSESLNITPDLFDEFLGH